MYVPADDPTDPAPATAFSHLDAFIYLERKISEKGIYPAIDPLASSSRILDPQYVGERHYEVARRVQQTLQRYRELQDIIAILGVDQLSEEDKRSCIAPAASSGSFRSRSSSPKCLPASRAKSHRLQKRSRVSRRSATEVGPPPRIGVPVRRRRPRGGGTSEENGSRLVGQHRKNQHNGCA